MICGESKSKSDLDSTVIIGDRGVLVADSCYLPSAAREDIAQIRQWTTKPVRYLLNTHWLFDHTMGNGGLRGKLGKVVCRSHPDEEEFDVFLKR